MVEAVDMTSNGYRNRWTQRHEAFCLRFFETGNATQSAIDAQYSPKSARACSSRLLTYANIKSRLAELRQQAEDASIATVQERQQILTEIARATLPDYMDKEGVISVGKDSPHVGAVSELTTKTRAYRRTGEVAVITNVKLHDPAKAIDLLNKMDKIYTEGATINVDKRTVIINVVSPEAKTLLDEVIEGSGTEKEHE